MKQAGEIRSLREVIKIRPLIAGPSASLERRRAARSFGVEVNMRAADEQIGAMQVPGTPCLVVDGKYRVELDSLSSAADAIDLVNFLVKKALRR